MAVGTTKSGGAVVVQELPEYRMVQGKHFNPVARAVQNMGGNVIGQAEANPTHIRIIQGRISQVVSVGRYKVKQYPNGYWSRSSTELDPPTIGTDAVAMMYVPAEKGKTNFFATNDEVSFYFLDLKDDSGMPAAMFTGQVPDIFYVTLSVSSGANGDKTTVSTYKYQVLNRAGNQIATDVTPQKGRPKGTITTGTKGIATYVGTTFYLLDAFEYPGGTGSC